MKNYRTAITFGRFNLLHKGHVDLFVQMSQAAQDVLIGVSTGKKNLTYRERSEVIATALKHEPDFTTPFQIQPKQSPFGLFEVVNNPEETILFLGHDQYELGQKLSDTYGCAVRTIPRLSSSTSVRALIDNEEWVMLTKEVPSSLIHQITLLRQRELELCPNSH